MKTPRKKIEMEIVTIDGPAGAGKSTVGKMLARRLKYLYLDTGAMYRAVGLRAKEQGVSPEDEAALKRLCRGLEITFREDQKGQRVICQGEDVTEKIRAPEIGWMASAVSMKRPVRQAMVRLQRIIGAGGKIVAEGRDTGTVVFPRAQYKFFLDADPEERARRRHRELVGKGLSAIIRTVEKEIRERDEQDSSRELAPLHPAADARHIDSTRISAEEVVERILAAIKKTSWPQAKVPHPSPPSRKETLAQSNKQLKTIRLPRSPARTGSLAMTRTDSGTISKQGRGRG